MNNFDIFSLLFFKRLILKHKITIPQLFYKFLKHYNAFNRYIYNAKFIGGRDVDFLNCYLSKRNADCLLIVFFGWKVSPEGREYWAHLNDVWNEIVDIYNEETWIDDIE